MVFYKEWSLVEVCKKSKIKKIKGCGVGFWSLLGFGVGLMVGVCLILRVEIESF